MLARGDPERDGPFGDPCVDAKALLESSDRGVVVLGVDRDAVRADACLKRFGRIEDDDLAPVHDRDSVAELGLVHVVGGHEDRDALGLFEQLDVAPDRVACLRIEPDRRLVEEQDARGVHEAAGDLQASAHPARERGHGGVFAFPQANHLENLLHPRSDQGLLDPIELGVQAQVLPCAQVAVQSRVLEHEADVATHVIAFADDVVAGDGRAARRRLGERAEHVDGGRLSCSVGAEEPEHLAGRHLEVDASHRLHPVVRLGQALDDDRSRLRLRRVSPVRLGCPFRALSHRSDVAGSSPTS